MNNFILISRTFSETTPESVEDGDFSDSGFISEREEVTFRELVEIMEKHRQPSTSGGEIDTNVWFSTGFEVIDYGSGTEQEECIHFHRDNTPNAEKYWSLAWKIARGNK